MFDMTKETGAFHNIYKTGIGAETEKRILHEGNESGEGTMRRFEVAPGIQITYNDLKMDSCFRPIRFEKDFLQIKIRKWVHTSYACSVSSSLDRTLY